MSDEQTVQAAEHADVSAACIGGLVPFSSVDWPGKLAAVIFIAGCPWRCVYCHNPHLQSRSSTLSWTTLRALLERRRGLLDAVVFSGGEPLSEPALPAMMEEVKAMGFQIALHTAGMYPRRLSAVLPLVDWIGLDVKADWVRNPEGHDKLTGRAQSHVAAAASLELVLGSGRAFECRTTWSPDWLSEAELLAVASELARRGVKHYAVQDYRAKPDAAPFAALCDNTQSALTQMFPQFSYR